MRIFNIDFNHIDSHSLAELISLERESAIYTDQYVDGDQDAHVRIAFTPDEVKEYVRSMAAYDQYVSQGSPISAYSVKGIPNDIAERADNYCTDINDPSFHCIAAFLGDELENLVCYTPSSRRIIIDEKLFSKMKESPQNKKAYDIALSFAGEDRTYVSLVADILKERQVSVFYDNYEKHNLWGKDLYAHLQDIYQNQSRYTIMFISKYYALKYWTSHERRSAQARAFRESCEYILPARFDNTEIPGLLETTGYIDLSQTTPGELADLIVAKLSN